MFSNITLNNNERMNDLVNHVFINNPGKNIRYQLIILYSIFLNDILKIKYNITVSESTIQKQMLFAAMVEVIHNSTLLHDDVLDDADLRRNKAAAHHSHSISDAVFMGSHMIAKMTAQLGIIDNGKVTELVSDMLDELVRGEVIQKKELLEMLPRNQYSYPHLREVMRV